MRKLVATIGRAEGMVVLVDRPGPRMSVALEALTRRLAQDFIVVSVRARLGCGLDELLDACTTAYRHERAAPSSPETGAHATSATVILIEDGDTIADSVLTELARFARLAKDRVQKLRIVLTGSPDLGPRAVRLELPLGGMIHAETCRIDTPAGRPAQRQWLLAGAGALIAAGFAALILTGESTPSRVSFEAPVHSPSATKVLVSPQTPAAPAASPAEPAGRNVASLLARAQRQIAAGRLDAPEDDNAFRTYQEIVILAPEDTAGPHLLSLIREGYLDRARDAEQRGDSEDALRVRDTARLLTPERAALLAQSRQ